LSVSEKSCGAMAEFFMMYCTGGPEWRGEGGEKKRDGQMCNSSEEYKLFIRSTDCEMLFI
jgi:hypothetical protein